MASKKVNKKSKKQDRRLKEVLKAHARSGLEGVGGEYLDAKQPKKLSHRLNLDVIKTDLIKTGLFAVFVVVLLIILKRADLNLESYFSINK